MLILTMVSTPAMAQDTCSVAQHAYDNCLQQAVPRYWNLKRMADSYPEGSNTRRMMERSWGLVGVGPDEFAQSQCSEFKTQMWQMGCPE